ncbi:MAG TPA: hypothetical protein VJM32_05860 [Candidatus Saccharimonadales bacterium]|nr:hypothetical protein [Candidatus Saccharimonadales bacterium]
MSDATSRTTAEMFSLDDFVHGRPERIIHAAKSPKILIVWHHGNEELGPRAARHIFTQRPDLAPHVDYLCGDPQGAATQSPAAVLGYDVNRSYLPADGPASYAQQRAQEILAVIRAGNYDFVLDLHTAVGEQEQFFIVTQELTPLIKKAVGASPITKVVAMPDFVTRKTLIGYAPNAVAFEVNEKFSQTPQAVQEVASIIEVLVGKAAPTPLSRDIFYVDTLVPKDQDPGEDAENFKLCRDGYYPIILGTGRHAYRNDPTKDYACFGAKRKETLVL